MYLPKVKPLCWEPLSQLEHEAMSNDNLCWLASKENLSVHQELTVVNSRIVEMYGQMIQNDFILVAL